MGLLYLGIAIVAAGLASYQTYTSVQWFSAARSLDLQVDSVTFHLDGAPLGYPYLIVTASVYNPASFNGLYLNDVTYGIFVNSTSQAFPSATGSTQVAYADTTIHRIIPGSKSLNLTFSLQVNPQIKDDLRRFLNAHNQTDLVTYVGADLYLHTVYATSYSNTYCYQLPEKIFSLCPPRYTVVGRAPTG